MFLHYVVTIVLAVINNKGSAMVLDGGFKVGFKVAFWLDGSGF